MSFLRHFNILTLEDLLVNYLQVLASGITFVQFREVKQLRGIRFIGIIKRLLQAWSTSQCWNNCIAQKLISIIKVGSVVATMIW